MKSDFFKHFKSNISGIIYSQPQGILKLLSNVLPCISVLELCVHIWITTGEWKFKLHFVQNMPRELKSKTSLSCCWKLDVVEV